MARHLDQILVVDLESTCWEGTPPEGEESEIIEIGVCLLDVTTRERHDKRSILVRPERSRVSPFCTTLTTLTQAQVDEGIPFAEALTLLRKKLRSDDRPWASYGDYDRRMVERQCQARGLRYPFGPGHLNVKSLLALCLGLPREVGLDEALRLLGLPLEGTHHRGHDDAWNIARVLAEILGAARAGLPVQR
ncbi:3'-5' exonuclease [Chondromyces apiculatus]|uniref:Putative exonuclease n=1 Tax=Chondromyces apiculatus DSM 436 TaxID=1192034 RepID=A0A017TFG6_9BACT|nr:3'-5' exonuclease [Chondromyces apiculatus]EYF07662.1 putative exonuclease [Chondromyces apiculatus DSM 436]